MAKMPNLALIEKKRITVYGYNFMQKESILLFKSVHMYSQVCHSKLEWLLTEQISQTDFVTFGSTFY